MDVHPYAQLVLALTIRQVVLMPCVIPCSGRGRYKLMAADLVATHSMMDHIGRFLPSVRCSGAAFSFVVNLIINYGSPVLHLVMVSRRCCTNGCALYAHGCV
jgi:hypothetical protein